MARCAVRLGYPITVQATRGGLQSTIPGCVCHMAWTVGLVGYPSSAQATRGRGRYAWGGPYGWMSLSTWGIPCWCGVALTYAGLGFMRTCVSRIFLSDVIAVPVCSGLRYAIVMSRQQCTLPT
ncbi:hypothetical protein OH77DRAFT_1272372 [Trametes cingulata]|nr:hypothetical protein OH77DRAFT_1272372 [Trametes cingulata]